MSFSLSFRFGFLTANGTATLSAGDEPTEAVNAAIRVRVYPSWYHYAAIDWSVPVEWGDCVFNVYHSTTEDGNYVKINPSPINGNSLVDYSAQDYSKFRNGYYIVEAVVLGSKSSVMRSTPSTWQNGRTRWVDLRASDIQRREFLLLRKFTGVKSYLFKRRTYGQRCSACWDPVSETVTRDRCPVCFGTSFEGGYFPPIPVFVQYEPTPNNLQKTYFGKFEPNQIGAWSIAIPEMAADDVLIRTGDWNVYKVGAVQSTELQAVPVRQIMQLNQLSRRDIENDLVKKRLVEFPTEYANVTAPQ